MAKADLMKYSNWALSNLCRGDITHKVQQESITAFTRIVLCFDNEEMLSEALNCMNDLIDSNLSRSLVEAGLVKRLSQIAQLIVSYNPLMVPITNIITRINSTDH